MKYILGISIFLNVLLAMLMAAMENRVQSALEDNAALERQVQRYESWSRK